MKLCARCSESFPDDAGYCATCGAPLERSTDRFLGRTIASRYRLVRKLGAGGMSVVYLARHELISRLSALKILRPELSRLPDHRERFLREARAVNRINHPNIVEISDVGESDGAAYLVMEYVAGEPLLSWIQRGPLPWELAARVGMQIASALARAHQLGVIHRDLKPENILLVTPSGSRADDMDLTVKLTDFGIAKTIDEPTLTLNEQLFGTPGYMAPEYVGGLEIDGRADIYSLAVVLYEMITGTLPFEGSGPSELLFRPLTTDPIPPSRRRAGVPPDLEALLLRCLSRAPEGRPHDAFAVHDALAVVVAGLAEARQSASRMAVASAAYVATERVPQWQEPSFGDRPSFGLQLAPVRTPEDKLAELEALVAGRRAVTGEHARAVGRAAELARVGAEALSRIERASKVVATQQDAVDVLEAQGRGFRLDLGHAIDVLVHDRSRARERLDALRGGHGHDAALAAQALDDLDFQIATLRAQLDAKNELFERELAYATGMLEGSLSALRSLHREVSRTIDDGISIMRRIA